MRLDFNVLWFDDQPETIRDVEGVLGPRLRELGFELQVQPFTDFSDIRYLQGVIREAAEEWDIDLIMLDFDLGQGSEFRGSELAVSIRQQFPHKDIVFYSGHAEGIRALREALYKNQIDGAYLAMRPQLDDHSYEIIQNLIKKVVDLDHMRGIVMAETSELDDLIGDCLSAAHLHLDDHGKGAIRGYVIKKLGSSLGSNSKKVAALPEGTAIDDIQALSPGVFSSYFQRGALMRALRTLGWEDSSEYAEMVALLSKYKEEVADQRDVLAHAKLVRDGGEKVLKGKNDVEISDDDMVGIRVAILRHRENIQSISAVLGEIESKESRAD